MSNASDFIIENGVLTKYVGPGGFLAIPEGVVSISVSAFENCAALKAVKLPQGVKRICKFAFVNCKNLKSLSLKAGLLSIEKEAFSGCASLQAVEIPISVASIGDDAFKGCNKISSFFAPGITPDEIKDKALAMTAVLTFLARSEDYTRPDIVSEYQQYAVRLKKSILPILFKSDSVKELNAYLVAGKVTPKSFEDDFLKPATAAGATECVAFLLKWKNENLSKKAPAKSLAREMAKDSLSVTDMKKLWSFEKLPDGTVEITGYKGEEVDVFIPERIGKEAVTSISEEAFCPDKARRTKAQADVMKAIKSVTMPESVTAIGSRAFSGCKSLRKIILPNDVRIGEGAFCGCKKLADTSGLVIFGKRVFDYAGSSGDVVIPDGVTAIEPSAFMQNKKIVSVHLPESIESIGRNAFEKCYELQTVNIPDKVTIIEPETFRWCKKLKTIHGMKSVTAIGGEAFSNCLELRLVEAPNVTKLEFGVFRNCGELSVAHFSEAVSVSNYSFSGCKKLADPNGFVVVGSVLFDYAGPGGDVVIPLGVRKIHSEAFCDCTELQSAKIPASVCEIDRLAFCYGDVQEAWAGTTVKLMQKRKPEIHAPAGSYAETYAKENNIPFVAE